LEHRVIRQEPWQSKEHFDEVTRMIKELPKCDLPKTKALLMDAQRKAQEDRKQKDEKTKREWEKDKAKSDMDLRGVNLEGADVRQLNLTGADCQGALLK
jgi:uncharacterized protein YjbI with pentapeptide repeats